MRQAPEIILEVELVDTALSPIPPVMVLQVLPEPPELEVHAPVFQARAVVVDEAPGINLRQEVLAQAFLDGPLLDGQRVDVPHLPMLHRRKAVEALEHALSVVQRVIGRLCFAQQVRLEVDGGGLPPRSVTAALSGLADVPE